MPDHIETRRLFLGRAASLGLLPLAGCLASPFQETRLPRSVADYFPKDGYPLVDVGGSHREIGVQIARAMGKKIGPFLAHSPLFQQCLAFLRTKSGLAQVNAFLAAARAHFPWLVEEVAGLASELGLPLLDLFAYQCKNEIKESGREAGCSTLVSWRPERLCILGHNEDGSADNAGAMFIVRVTPPSGVKFLALAYPGLLPGNGPGFNSRGIVQTTNYIRPRKVQQGIPRYFISRALMEARDLDHAQVIATTSPRAFPFHHNLCSLAEEGKYVSLETHPKRWHKRDIRGNYFHTNHFLHPEMLNPAGEAVLDHPYESSLTRYRVLKDRFNSATRVTGTTSLLPLFSCHVGHPFSPCRHPEGKITGITLGTAFFVRSEMRMVLYEGNPCLGRRREYTLCP